MLAYCQLDSQEQISVNLNLNSTIYIHENAFEKVICEMAVILSRGDELSDQLRLYDDDVGQRGSMWRL